MRKVFEESDETRCRYCGSKLSLLQRLSRQEFCSPEHRAEYQKEQESLALARLQQSSVSIEPPGPLLPPAPGEAPPPNARPSDPPLAWFADIAPDSSPMRKPMHGDSEDPVALPPLWTSGKTDLAPERSFKWEPAGKAGFENLVAPVQGDVFTILELDPVAQDTAISPRLGAGITPSPFDWSQPEEEPREELQEGPQEEEGPPLAGLLPIEGPQTLRFEMVVARPEPEPLTSGTAPSRIRWSVTEAGSKKRSLPKLAGRVRPSWKTRFGQVGYFNPRAVAGSTEPLRVVTPRVLRPRCGFELDTSNLPSAMRASTLDGSQLHHAGLCRIGHDPVDYRCAPRMVPPADMGPISVAAAARWLHAGLSGWIAGTVQARVPVPRDPKLAMVSWTNTIAGPKPVRLAVPPRLCKLPPGQILPGYVLIEGVRLWPGFPQKRRIAPQALGGQLAPAPPSGPWPSPGTLRRARKIAFATSMTMEPRARKPPVAPETSRAGVVPPLGVAAFLPETRVSERPRTRMPAPAEVLFELRNADIRDVAGKRKGRRSDVAGDESWRSLVSHRNAGWTAMTSGKQPMRPARLPAPFGETRVPLDAFDTEVEPTMEPLTCSFDSGGGSWDSLI